MTTYHCSDVLHRIDDLRVLLAGPPFLRARSARALRGPGVPTGSGHVGVVQQRYGRVIERLLVGLAALAALPVVLRSSAARRSS